MFAILISVLALLATFYQAYLQRVHNEKSVKPLGQIEVGDLKDRIYIYIRNNGVGPLIIDKLTFTKHSRQYTDIKDCLNIDPKSYMHISVSDTMKKIVPVNSHHIVFEKDVENYSDSEIEAIRKELSPITLKVDCRDIYDNKSSFERNLEWFARYFKDDSH